MSEDAPESHAEPRIAEVLAAADAIVAAFASTDTQAYFAGFAPDATFVFHPEAKRFDSRAPDGRESYRERESIVFRLLGDARLIAVHEHLSTVPATAYAASDAEADTDAEAVPQ
jgi:ketosteroid isomerase-like protein